jgi:DNA-binding transcriptional MerR regulator
MVIINGQSYSTIADAAEKFKVSAKTIRTYILKKIIPKPPTIKYGVRTIYHFPTNYLHKAEKSLQKYRG